MANDPHPAPSIDPALLHEKHRGTLVWQTQITDESGRLLSMTTQTQMVLVRRQGA